MTVEASAEVGLEGRYASALFELADSAKQLDSVAGDLTALRKAIDDSADLRRLIASPIVSADAQAKAMQAVAEAMKLAPLSRQFLGVVVQKRRLSRLPGMIRAFLAELARRRGESSAEVVSAVPLTDAQTEKLSDVLRGLVGRKITLEQRVDPDILGGLVVRVGSRMFDSSIRTKLQRLQLAMKGVG
jgi:F-type H+-transporting ATPase subunit delta